MKLSAVLYLNDAPIENFEIKSPFPLTAVQSIGAQGVPVNGNTNAFAHMLHLASYDFTEIDQFGMLIGYRAAISDAYGFFIGGHERSPWRAVSVYVDEVTDWASAAVRFGAIKADGSGTDLYTVTFRRSE